MSFTMECPFCSKQIKVPDEMAGQTAACPSCGQEVYLDRDDARTRSEERRAEEIRTARAAVVASMPTSMPKVTWSWAFSFVLKISVAAAVIDGLLTIAILLFLAAVRFPHRY